MAKKKPVKTMVANLKKMNVPLTKMAKKMKKAS